MVKSEILTFSSTWCLLCQHTKLSSQDIHFIEKIYIFVYVRVKNSINHLTIGGETPGRSGTKTLFVFISVFKKFRRNASCLNSLLKMMMQTNCELVLIHNLLLCKKSGESLALNIGKTRLFSPRIFLFRI